MKGVREIPVKAIAARARTLNVWVLVVFSAIVLACVGSARAQQLPDSAGRILVQNGRVSVENGGDLWALMPGKTITSGQVVVTGPDGYAQVELSDHSIIEVFPNSRIVFRPNRSNWRDLIDIFLGKVRLQIQHLTNGDAPYRVTSPTAVISIRGTVLDVEVSSGNETTVQVETGVVGVRHRLFPGKEVTVETGQTIRVVPNLPLAAAKSVSRLVLAGRIARAAGDTIARIGNTTGRSDGPRGGSKPGAGSGGGGVPSGTGSGSGAAGVDGSSAGANEPAPPPGQDGNSGSSGNGNDNSGPPGDVIR